MTEHAAGDPILVIILRHPNEAEVRVPSDGPLRADDPAIVACINDLWTRIGEIEEVEAYEQIARDLFKP